MSNIISSFLSLVKNNDGAFKSEKQSAFLLSRMDNGVFTTTQAITFGEYDSRTNKNTSQITWTVYADAKGVTKVEKYTSKQGTTLYWERSEAFLAAAAERKAIARAEHISSVKCVQAHTMARIKELLSEMARLETEQVKAILSKEQLATITSTYKAKINQEMADYQEWAIRQNLPELFG